MKTPDYIEEVRSKPGQANLSAAEIERSILRQKKYRDGLGFKDHLLSYCKHLLPDKDWHEFRQWFVLRAGECLDTGIKELSVSGCTNSGKTSTAAYLLNAIWSIWPENSTVYMAGQTKNAGQSTIWGESKEVFLDIKSRNPWFPGYSDKDVIYYDDKIKGRAKIEVLAGDNLGQLQGRKLIDPDKDGFLIVVFDECPEYPNMKAFEVNDNLVDNEKYLGLFMGNFGDVNDILGRIMTPKEGYSSLDVDGSQEWRTITDGIALRFDGHKSPNIILGEDRYSYLLKNTTVQKTIARYGGSKTSPGYMKFVRAFPQQRAESRTILSESDLRAYGGYRDYRKEDPDKIVFRPSEIINVGFCDPGFGGDPCVALRLEVRVDYDGNQVVWFPEGALYTIPVDTQSDVPVNKQIALECVQYCRRHRIDPVRFGFDPSLRSGIAIEMARHGFVPQESNDRPSDRRITEDVTAKDQYTNANDEQHFVVQELLYARRLTGCHHVQEAVDQLKRRKYRFRGSKMRVQSKDEYKKENLHQSPNEADALVGAVRRAVEGRWLKMSWTSSRSKEVDLSQWLEKVTEIYQNQTSESIRPKLSEY